MITRIHLDDEHAATALAEAIDGRGLDVAVIAERFAGEDDDEAIEYVVCVNGAKSLVDDLLGEDLFVTEDQN